MESSLSNCTHDIFTEIKQSALNAKSNKLRATSEEDEMYAFGYLMAYHEVMSLIVQQLDAFGIDKAKFSLDEFNPDFELLA